MPIILSELFSVLLCISDKNISNYKQEFDYLGHFVKSLVMQVDAQFIIQVVMDCFLLWLEGVFVNSRRNSFSFVFPICQHATNWYSSESFICYIGERTGEPTV